MSVPTWILRSPHGEARHRFLELEWPAVCPPSPAASVCAGAPGAPRQTPAWLAACGGDRLPTEPGLPGGRSSLSVVALAAGRIVFERGSFPAATDSDIYA